ncbi:L,D-transpeptidase family protein [Sulfurovum lithotrophicum]|uniref:L,D-transpeptidase family protein n=1 Tax=Sulfurovum lithotrophicum TaxID=206403 RepID=UPI00069847A8|nr:L,D-transpeptidase family protein [Sulfurovum lithotrophicum]
MKFIIPLLFSTLLFALNPDPNLLRYQHRYSLCHGKTNYQIVQCLVNGNLDYSRFRGERFPRKKISRKAVQEAEQYGDLFEYTMQLLPQSRRYIELRRYLDYLYSIRDIYRPPLFRGDQTDDILRIKSIFRLLGVADLPPDPYVSDAFVEAVKTYQRRWGLAVDRKIGPQTKRYMRQPISAMITKVKKNLVIESIVHEKPATYVLVNIPEFAMHYYENGWPALNMKVVVGKPKMRTPVFHRNMQYIVENPRWNVPPSIYAKEYANKSESYLRKKGLFYNSDGKLYQRPGRRNSLGLVKFLFPNRFNVYMHDTPSKYLFKRYRRAYSHGCIRLEKPFALLNKLGYTYRPGKTRWITLKHTIPVYVEYHTVWVDDNGIVQFRPDIYGYERKLFPRR